jgi:hypothetical protein
MRFKSLVFGAMAAALILAVGSTTAVAQTGFDDVYAVSHFSNAHVTGAPDGVLRLVNDGTLSDSSPAGDLCASVYVFDSQEELAECCSCKITPNGILSLSVNNNLTKNTLTGVTPPRGVIKDVSSEPTNGRCDPTTFKESQGIRGWITHPQKGTGTGFGLTEEELMDSFLSTAEANDLAEDCKVLVELGSGHGICSCADSKQ